MRRSFAAAVAGASATAFAPAARDAGRHRLSSAATRGDIERIRGVTVSPNHIGFLEECGWIEEAGRRETPGRPQLFATTTVFLDDLGLTSLDELPPPEEFENIDFTAPTANEDDDAGHRDDDDDDGANKGESKDAQHN